MRIFLLSFLLFAFSIFSVVAQCPVTITPNTVQENNPILQVFISGSTQSQFEEWSLMAPAQLRLNDGSNLISVSNNYFNWQYNSSVGCYGFYTDFPANMPVGSYVLEVNNCWTSGGCWSTLNTNAFTVTAIPGQITSITPNTGVQSQRLTVAISGVNINFQNWSWGTVVFSQYSGTSFSGYLSNFNTNNVSLNYFTIPSNVDTGLYDLTVSTQLQSSLPSESYTLNNAFRVYEGVQFVSPTTAIQGENIQLFVAYPQSTYLYLSNSINQLSPTDFCFGDESLFASNVSSFQWNSNLNSYGWYVDFQIPLNFPTGSIALNFWNNGNIYGKIIESHFTIIPVPPTITSISPNQGSQGQNLSVTISGANMYFGNQWSGISTFRLQDANGQDIWGTSTSTSGNDLYGDITIPSNASLGSFYHLDVWDYGTSQFIRKDSAFEITLPSSYAMMPNTAEQGESLQVFISGSNVNFIGWTHCPDPHYGDLRLKNNNDVFPVINNANQIITQYGVNGFLTNLLIPNVPVGLYHLQINHCSGMVNGQWHNCGDCWSTLASNAFTVTPSPPKVFSIVPNSGSTGHSLSVAISGINMDFGNQWSGISTFRLQDTNGQNIYGTSTATVGDSLFGDINIPSNTSYGYYNLDVWNYGTSQWVRKDNAFNVLPPGPIFNSTQNTYHQSIQDAIDNAVNGDIIIVSDGSYYESFSFDNKQITIESQNGFESTVLYSGNSYGTIVQFSGNENTNSILSGFSLNGDENGPAQACYGLEINSASPIIKDCYFYDFGGCASAVPVSAHSSSNHIVKNSIFANNEDIWNINALNCTFIGNAGSYGEYRNCIISGYTYYGTLSYCVFNNPNNGSEVNCMYGVSPLLVDPANGDFSLQTNSPCIDAGDPNPIYNDPDGTRNDIGALYYHQNTIAAGCTNPIACNYDSLATIDDSSCIYLSNPVVDLTQNTWTVVYSYYPLSPYGAITDSTINTYFSNNTGVSLNGNNFIWSACDSSGSAGFPTSFGYTIYRGNYSNGIISGYIYVAGVLSGSFYAYENINPTPQVNSIDPDNGQKGQSLYVQISGTNMNFSTSSSTLSSFRFSQFSGT
ncbi:MAG: hypothetical protein VX347_03590, partial [Bacteroidota bacterium]|nr:hypothetical protein [Bacteroidota bacterium]